MSPIAPRRHPRGPRPGRPPRRLGGLLIVSALVGLTIIGRLTQLQGLSAERLASLAESQTLRTVELPGERGTIFDRNGHELAISVPQTTVWADPRLVTDPAGDASRLSKLLGVEKRLLQARLSRPAAFVYLARQVPDDVAAKVKALALPGVFFIEEPKRFAPAGPLAAPLLGKVGIDNTGLSGLELLFEDELAGRPGQLVVERAPDGVAIPTGRRQLRPPAPGEDLVLTIDRAIQFEAERLLAQAIVQRSALGGVIVVTDPRTGDVLAMANLARKNGDRGAPVVPAGRNTAITDVFEPGSVNKVITIAAALEEGLVDPGTVFEVPDSLPVADHVFSDHDPHPPMRWSVSDILVHSSNIGSIMIGQRLGPHRIDRYLRKFGFGETTGLGFPGESAGLMLPPDRWSGTSIGTVPIGQGLAVTALQMLAAYDTVANGGEYVAPRLVHATIDRDGDEHLAPRSATRRVVSSETAAQMTQMLSEVVRSGTGTLGAIDGYTVAGKTGTARKPLEGARGYKAGAYLSSFAGFVPADDPRLSIIVVLDEPFPIYGGIVAAPVFAELAGYSMRLLHIPPPPAMKHLDRGTTTTAPESAGGLVRGSPATTMPPPVTAPPVRPVATTVPGRAGAP